MRVVRVEARKRPRLTRRGQVTPSAPSSTASCGAIFFPAPAVVRFGDDQLQQALHSIGAAMDGF